MNRFRPEKWVVKKESPVKQHNRFRPDNTPGYDADELAELNHAFDQLVEAGSTNSADIEDHQSFLDDCADHVLSSFDEDREGKVVIRDWIVIQGNIIASREGGGYEFMGPFSEAEAKIVRDAIKDTHFEVTQAVQLIKVPTIVGEHWNPNTPEVTR